MCLVDRSLQGLFRINRLNGIGPNACEGTAGLPPYNPCVTLEHPKPTDWESILRREENRSTPRKTLGVRLRSTETQPTYDPRPGLHPGNRRGRRSRCPLIIINHPDSPIRRILWFILSKALLISNKTIAVSSFLSMLGKIWSVEWISAVSVECHFLVLFCFVESRLFATGYVISWFRATFSQTFDNRGNKENGFLLLRILWSPSFGIGITSAFIQTCGKVPLMSEPLMMHLISCEIIGRQSFTNYMWRSSTLRPGPLFIDCGVILL